MVPATAHMGETMPASPPNDSSHVQFRCPTCGDVSARKVEWCQEHTTLPCDSCGAFIDLSTDENRARIAAEAKLRDRLQPRR